MNKKQAVAAAVIFTGLIIGGCGRESVTQPAAEATATISLKVAFDLTTDNGTVTDVHDIRNNVQTNSGPVGYRVDSVTLSSGLAMVRSLRFVANPRTSADSTITAADEQRDLTDAAVRFHGPYVVQATGAMQELEATTVPSGFYKQVSFVLQKARASDNLGDNENLTGSSISVTGKVWRNGQPTDFTFTTDYTAEIAVNGGFNIPDHFNGSLSLTFDAGHWFRSGAGWLDPNDPGNRPLIIGSVRYNVKAYILRGIRNIGDLNALN